MIIFLDIGEHRILDRNGERGMEWIMYLALSFLYIMKQYNI